MPHTFTGIGCDKGSRITSTHMYTMIVLTTLTTLYPVTIEMTDGEPRLTYEAIGIELTVLEELDQSGSADALGATGTTTIQSAELDGAGDPFVYAEIEAPV